MKVRKQVMKLTGMKGLNLGGDDDKRTISRTFDEAPEDGGGGRR